eukprot:jgi/Tetstr1/429546/TSEL_019450.t1
MAPAITLVELLRNTTNDVGTATAFDVTSEFLGSVTPTNDGTTVTYAGASVGRTGLTPGTAYYYWLSVTDQAGLNTVQYLGTITTASAYSPLITAAVDFNGGTDYLSGTGSSTVDTKVGWDNANSKRDAYLDGNAVTLTLAAQSDFAVRWDESNMGVGVSGSGMTGCMAEFYATTEYLDLSVEANRRKFISATGAPVSLGADGSTPTGTQPLVYMSGAAANWNAGKNFGSWSDFTVTGALTDCASSPELWPIDISAAVDFDGTNDSLVGTTGTAFSKVGTVSMWFKWDGAIAGNSRLISSSGVIGPDNIVVRTAASDNALRVYCSGSATAVTAVGATAVNDSSWHHFIMSWDTANSVFHMYLDDADDVSGTPSLNDINVLWSASSFYIGSRDGADFMHGCMAELYATTEYLDLSVEANRRKFISATGAPVSLGADGSTPTGTQPLIYMSGEAANWNAGKNFGSWSDFTVTGALTDCASTPGISSQVIPAWVDLNTTNVGSISGGFGNINVASGERRYDDDVVNEYVDVTIQATLPGGTYITSLEPTLFHTGNNQLTEFKFYDSSDQLVQSNSYSLSAGGGGSSPGAVVPVEKAVKRMTVRSRRQYVVAFQKMLLFGF